MITPKFLPFNALSVTMASIAKGKVWMVTTMMGVPAISASASCLLLDFEVAALAHHLPELERVPSH